MGKRAATELAETPTKTYKREMSLVSIVADKMEPETVKKAKKSKHQKAEVEETVVEELPSEALKKEKKKQKQEQAKAEAEEVEAGTPKKEKRRKNKEAYVKGEAEAMPEVTAEDEADEAKRKRKEEKKKRKRVTEEVTATAEEQAEGEAPKKKRQKESGAAADEMKAEVDADAAKTHGKSSASSSGNKLIVLVGGLSLTCTEEVLCKEFSKCGEIATLKVPGKKKSHGIAFITYTSKKDVEKALKLNASDYEGCTLRVNLSEKEAKEKSDQAEGNRNSNGSSALQVFVGGLPVQAAEGPLREHFCKCGKIASFLMPLSARNCPKGLAYITYKTQEGFDKALARHGTDFDGRTLKVNKADADNKEKNNEERGNSKVAGEGSSSLKMFVGGLPLEANEASLRKTFGECGEIASLKRIVPSNPETKRGIVFITYKTQKGFDKALVLDGTDYEGCTLKVKHAGGGRGRDKDSTPKGKGKDGKDGKGKGKLGKGKGKGKGKKGKASGKRDK